MKYVIWIRSQLAIVATNFFFSRILFKQHFLYISIIILILFWFVKTDFKLVNRFSVLMVGLR